MKRGATGLGRCLGLPPILSPEYRGGRLVRRSARAPLSHLR